MRKSVIAVAAVMLAGAATAQDGSAPAMPGWLTGCWIEQKEAAWTEECWTSARGGVMIGSGRSGTGDRVASWETMQILRDYQGVDGLAVRMALLAAPADRGRTMFAWSPSAQAGVTFHNMANDYPQRVRYWREGKFLHAEIAMADGSRAKRWKFTRM